MIGEGSEEVQVLSDRMQMCTTSDSEIHVDKVFDSRSTLDSKKKIETRNKMQLNSPKPVNINERIIFIVDATTEPNSTNFELGRGDKFPPLFMIKRVVEIFINVKSTINPNHEYALVVLSGSEVRLVKNFSNKTTDFVTYIDDIEESQSNSNVFDLSKLFSELEEIVVRKDAGLVTRAILIYCRSHTVPMFTHKMNFDNLMKKQRFFLDILYIHEHAGEDNQCETIYSALNALDVKSSAYIFEVGRNATRLHDHMVKLVAHPLQRPPQRAAHYSLESHLANLSALLHEGHTSV